MKVKMIWKGSPTEHERVYMPMEEKAIARVAYHHGITTRFSNMLQIRRSTGHAPEVQKFMLYIRQHIAIWNMMNEHITAMEAFGEVRIFNFQPDFTELKGVGLVGVKWSKATLKGQFPVGTKYFILARLEEEDAVLKEFMHNGTFNPWEGQYEQQARNGHEEERSDTDSI